MPAGNNFQHSDYTRANPGDRVSYREAEPWAPLDSLAGQDALARQGTQMAQHGVRAVLFVHGAHLGTDLFGMQRLDEAGGLKRGYSRGIPGMEALLALMRDETNGLSRAPGGYKPPLDDVEQVTAALDSDAKDAANFTAAYVQQFEKGVARDATARISCIRHLWSSEHHHLGRAKAACRLLDRLRRVAAELKVGNRDRILVQAHGHAGQVLALVSNLLSTAASSGRKALLETLRAYLEAAGTAPDVLEALAAVEPQLTEGTLLNGAALDVVTFGTPVRYGWDSSSLGRLLHIVNHRPMRQDGKRWLAKTELPQITMEMPIAWGGDYVQQLAVAGCDAVPRDQVAKEANKALWEIVEPWDGFERWLECARRCVRCANDGQCLLIDYKDATGSTNALDHVFGHAAYTRLSHLLFNTNEIVKALYSDESSQPAS